MAKILTTDPADLRKLLNQAVALVTFIKLDGSMREMLSTTNPEYIPASDMPKSETAGKKEDDDVNITVFDLDKNGWRTIKYDRIVSVENASAPKADGSTDTFSFGEALQFLKYGHTVARQGWNGKKMFVWMETGSRSIDSYGTSDYINGVSEVLFDVGDKDTVTRMPFLCMRAADGSTVVGWLASQTDLLAEDWIMSDE